VLDGFPKGGVVGVQLSNQDQQALLDWNLHLFQFGSQILGIYLKTISQLFSKPVQHLMFRQQQQYLARVRLGYNDFRFLRPRML